MQWLHLDMTEELVTGTLHLKVNVPCSRTQHGATTGHPTQDLSIRCPMLHHYATGSPTLNEIFKQCKFESGYSASFCLFDLCFNIPVKNFPVRTEPLLPVRTEPFSVGTESLLPGLSLLWILVHSAFPKDTNLR